MTKAQHYPKAALRITGIDGGTMDGDGSKKITLHTTETPESGFYRRYTYYHIQVRQDPTTGEVSWEQAIPFERASRALRNGSDPIQTNRDGDVHINLAIVGYARNSAHISDKLLREIAEFAVWAEKEWGIPAKFAFPKAVGGGEGYGADGAYRIPPAAWDYASGTLTHAQCPDSNTHWDPGPFPVERFHTFIAEIKAAEDLPPTTTPDQEDSVLTKLPTLKLYDGYKSGRPERKPWVQRLQAILAIEGFIASNTFNANHQPDGLFGPGTLDAVKRFQKDKGLKVDGIVAEVTWAKLMAV